PRRAPQIGRSDQRLSRRGGGARATGRRRHHHHLRISVALSARDRPACRRAGRDVEPDADPVHRAHPAVGQTRRRAEVSAASLTPEHMTAAGADPNTPVVGTENGREFTRVMLDEKHTLDAAAAERDILDAGEALVSRHPDTGAVVLECTNMVPFARALSDHLLLPVFSIYTFVT